MSALINLAMHVTACISDMPFLKWECPLGHTLHYQYSGSLNCQKQKCLIQPWGNKEFFLEEMMFTWDLKNAPGERVNKKYPEKMF